MSTIDVIMLRQLGLAPDAGLDPGDVGNDLAQLVILNEVKNPEEWNQTGCFAALSMTNVGIMGLNTLHSFAIASDYTHASPAGNYRLASIRRTSYGC